MPKRQADEFRPVAVGSTILRAWLKILQLLPEVPARQFGGRAGVSVAAAIGDWLAHRGPCGAELDLAKAFDNVAWDAADAALAHAGVAPSVILFLRQVWSGPRFCSLLGTLSSPLHPVRGIPQGDPTSPCILAQVLRPWHALMERERPEVANWAIIEDRSLRAADGASLRRAVDATTGFDAAVGLRENLKKRQLWSAGHYYGPQPVACRTAGSLGGVCDLLTLLGRPPRPRSGR